MNAPPPIPVRAPLRSDPEPRRHVVGALARRGAEVAPHVLVRDVAERFRRDADLDAVALVEAGRPAGLLTRTQLLFRLGRSYGHELFARKPISRIADPEPLALAADTDVADAVARALARPAERVYDEVIVVDEAGRYLGLLSIRELAHRQRDALATTLAEVESAIARERELERVERLRAQFLAHATHELRSPVNAIAGIGELLRRALDQDRPDLLRARIELLQQTAGALRGTVNDLLVLSKLEAGRMEVVRGPVELAPLLDEVAALARVLAGSRPISVVVLGGAAPPIATDRQKVRQILVNLASNAVKFTDAGRIVLGARVESGAATLWVEDTGTGIAPDDLGRLFVAFGQIEDAQTKSHEGTGLGLVITKSLVQLLGGRISVESRRGAGSRFTVHLPLEGA